MSKPNLALAAAVAGVVASLVSGTQAQSWPQRTVHFIVGQGAGSAQDIGARLFGSKLAER